MASAPKKSSSNKSGGKKKTETKKPSVKKEKKAAAKKTAVKKASAKKTAAKKSVRKKAAAKKTVASGVSSQKARIKKKKQNLLRIYSEMSKLSNDAVDREVLKRFKIIIDTSEEDITKVSMNTILKDPRNVNVTSFHESIQPYIKHFLFLQKREKKKS